MADRAKFRPLILHGNRRDKRQSGLRYSRRAAEHRENSPRTLRRGPKALLSLPLREHSPGAFAARGTAILPDNVGNKSYSLGRRQLPSLLALWPYVARHRGMVFAALIALVASAAAMLTVPVAVRRMVDVGFAAHDGGFIDRYFATLIAIGLVLAMASSGRMYAVNWLGERVVADLRSDVFRHLATLGPPFYDRTHSGEVMSRLTADTTQIKGAAGSALSQALRNLIMLIGALTMMFVTSPTLAALGLAAIPVIVFPMLAYGRAVRRLSRTAQDRLADASAYAAENLGAVRTMHAFGQQTTVSRRFADASERAFDAARSRRWPAPGSRRSRSASSSRVSSVFSGSDRAWSSPARSAAAGSVSSCSTRCLRPARLPSSPRYGARFPRQPALLSASWNCCRSDRK